MIQLSKYLYRFPVICQEYYNSLPITLTPSPNLFSTLSNELFILKYESIIQLLKIFSVSSFLLDGIQTPQYVIMGPNSDKSPLCALPTLSHGHHFFLTAFSRRICLPITHTTPKILFSLLLPTRAPHQIHYNLHNSNFFKIQPKSHLLLEVFASLTWIRTSCANSTNWGGLRKKTNLKFFERFFEGNKCLSQAKSKLCWSSLPWIYSWTLFLFNYKGLQHILFSGTPWISLLSVPLCKTHSIIVAFLEYHPNWNVNSSWTGTVAFLVYTQWLSWCLPNTRSSINAYMQKEKEGRERTKREERSTFLLA